MTVAFTLNNREVCSEAGGAERLLDVLRDEFGLTGAKEGCGEGECGACTVLLDGKPVCACLVPLCQVEGCVMLTVEGVADGDELAPLQQALLDGGGIQCGACTPGIVLAAGAHLAECDKPTRAGVNGALAGNICRCTGYERITRSVLAAAKDRELAAAPFVRARRDEPGAEARSAEGDTELSLPATASTTLVAGGTDLLAGGTAAWEGFRRSNAVMDLTRMPALKGVRMAKDHLDIGAAVTFTELRHHPLVCEHLPMLAAVAGMIGARQIQNRATLGGNMANASPAGDSLPVLLALDAEVLVVGAGGERRVPYAEFHTGYRQTILEAGELIKRVLVPLPKPGSRWYLRKVGTRAAQAISKVLFAACFEMEAGAIVRARLASGSVSPVPLCLRRAAAACATQRPTEELARRVARLARSEATPIDDVRSSARYRSHVLARLVRRAVLSLQA